MDFKFKESDSIDTLEEYAVFLGVGMLNLKSLENVHIRAVEIGILDDSEEQYALNIIQNLRMVFHLYKSQLETVFERMPENFEINKLADELLKKTIKSNE